jgi:PAS domain S-box-containing protein
MTQPAKLHLVGYTSLSAAPLPDSARAWAPGHDVQFYESEEFLASSVSNFLAEGARAGQPLVVIATDAHRKAFRSHLLSLGLPLDDHVAGPAIVWLDARETLNAFMEGPTPNRELFEATVGDVFEKIVTGRRYLVIRAYGEMVDLLWKDGNIEGAIALEELWNELAVKYSFSLLCAYSMGNFFKEAHTHSFRQICAHHGRVVPTESYLMADEAERLRQITLLQQRARALEAEVAHRREVEAALRDVLAHRRRMEDSARRSENELRDFLENAAEGMHWVGPDGIVIWANRAELELLGYEADEYIGHHIAEFHADPRAIADILTRLGRNETLREYEATLVCKDGSRKHVLISSNVLYENGEFVHTRCFTRDVTRLKQRPCTNCGQVAATS